MSGDAVETRRGPFTGAEELLRRAAAAERRARAITAAAAQDFSVTEAFRLDERTRNGMTALLEEWVGTAERALAAFSPPGTGSTFPWLRAAGLLNDWALTDALLGQVRQDQLGRALPHHAPNDPAQASLVNRFVHHPVREIADAARDLLLAEKSSKGGDTERRPAPRDIYAKLLWWVASATREQAGSTVGVEFDAALCAAVRHALAAAKAPAELSVETAATRFAVVIASSPADLPETLTDALRDRRLALFLAVLAHAADIAFADARALVLDRHPERLLLALHALGLPRGAMAQIGFLLCEADPGRDVAVLADGLDALGAVERVQAWNVLAELRLDPAYHAARAAIRRGAMAGWSESAR